MKKSRLLRHLFTSTFITMFLVELANTVSCVVDGLVTSRFLGGEQMAAYGIASPYFSVASIISGILMVGAQTYCAASLGSGDRDAADRAFSTVCVAGVVLSTLFGILGFIFSDQIAMLFGARGDSAALCPYASQYLKGLFVGSPFFVMMAVLAPIVQLDGGGNRANLASIVVTVTDIAVDLIGVLLFKGGLLVIAIATSFSFFAADLVLLTHFFKKNTAFHFRLKNYDKAITADIMKSGMPRGVSMLCRALGPIIINAVVLRVAATSGMTAMSVQSNVKFIVNTPACGIAGAVLLLGSLYFGQKDKSLLKETMAVSFKYVGMVVGAVTILTFALSGAIAKLYIPEDAAVAALATEAIRWYALALPFLAVNQILASFLQATGKITGSYLMNIGSEMACTVACVYLLSSLFGLSGIWAAFPAGQVLLLALYLVAALVSRTKAKKCSDKLLLLQDDFGVSDDNRLFALTSSMDEALDLSVQTKEFCAARGIDARRSYLASLFVEELVGNVIQHGFKDKKKHLLETVITIDGEDVIVHIQDDCRQFDLKKKAENWKKDPEHPEKNIGIRMVLGMAKDVSYAAAMNTNSVFVKI